MPSRRLNHWLNRKYRGRITLYGPQVLYLNMLYSMLIMDYWNSPCLQKAISQENQYNVDIMRTRTKRLLKLRISVKERPNAVVAKTSSDSSNDSAVGPSAKSTVTKVDRAPYTRPQCAPHFMVHEKSF